VTPALRTLPAHAVAFALALGGMAAARPASAGESWVGSVSTSPVWAAYACHERLLTRVCDTDKRLEEPGELPPVVAVCDVLHYTSSRGQSVTFIVRAISLYVFDRDTDAAGSSTDRAGRKGETLCSLFDTASRERIARGYASRITIKGCRKAHE